MEGRDAETPTGSPLSSPSPGDVSHLDFKLPELVILVSTGSNHSEDTEVFCFFFFPVTDLI